MINIWSSLSNCLIWQHNCTHSLSFIELDLVSSFILVENYFPCGPITSDFMVKTGRAGVTRCDSPESRYPALLFESSLTPHSEEKTGVYTYWMSLALSKPLNIFPQRETENSELICSSSKSDVKHQWLNLAERATSLTCSQHHYKNQWRNRCYGCSEASPWSFWSRTGSSSCKVRSCC